MIFFSWLPLLWATNTHAKREREEEKRRGIFYFLPWAFILREAQLTWVSLWWRVINKCIWLIIKDSLNEDRYHPLKACSFQTLHLNSGCCCLFVCPAGGQETYAINLYIFLLSTQTSHVQIMLAQFFFYPLSSKQTNMFLCLSNLCPSRDWDFLNHSCLLIGESNITICHIFSVWLWLVCSND